MGAGTVTVAGLTLSAFVAILILLLARASRARWRFCGALAIGAASAALRGIGAWGYATSPIPSRLGASAYDFIAVVLVLVVIVALARRPDLSRFSPLMLVAGLALAIGTGLANVTYLFRSQLPTTLPQGVARNLVAVALGIGVGLAAIGRAPSSPRADRTSVATTPSSHTSRSANSSAK